MIDGSIIVKVAFQTLTFCYNFYNKRKSTPLEKYELRTKLFYNEIMPQVLSEVIPLKSEIINKRLKTITIGNEIFKLPYIDILKGNEVRLPDRLPTSIRTPSHDKKTIQWLQKELNKTVYNNPTFTLNGVSINNNKNKELLAGISDYYSNISTSDIHFFNLINYAPINKYKILRKIFMRTDMVNEWISKLEDIIKFNKFDSYHASLGCSVLTVLNSDDGYKYLIMNNTNKKAPAAFDKHVIPSFMFQPISRRLDDQTKELDVNISVLKEFGEELLGLKELESTPTYDSLLNHLLSNESLAKLKSQIDSQKAYLTITGLSLDLFRLRPEINFVLVIHDKQFSKILKTNWEWTESSLDLVPVQDQDAYEELIKANQSPLCPPGLSALINGRDIALQIIENSTQQ